MKPPSCSWTCSAELPPSSFPDPRFPARIMPVTLPPDLKTELQPLLEQRAQLKQWIARLDDHRADASPPVWERVREDYLDRLQELLETLAVSTELLQELKTQRSAEAEATMERRSRLAEEVEEQQLRHLAGEIQPERWTELEPELQAQLADAAEEEQRLRTEAEELAELVGEIERIAGGERVAAWLGAAESNFTEVGDPFGSWEGSGATEEATPPQPPIDAEELPWLDLLEVEDEEGSFTEAEASHPGGAGVPTPEYLGWIDEAGTSPAAEPAEGDEFAFLEELDRALATNSQDARGSSTRSAASCSAFRRKAELHCVRAQQRADCLVLRDLRHGAELKKRAAPRRKGFCRGAAADSGSCRGISPRQLPFSGSSAPGGTWCAPPCSGGSAGAKRHDRAARSRFETLPRRLRAIPPGAPA